MITLKLTDDEAVILHNVIKASIEDLRMEIMHTDRREYREMLKKQEELEKKILEKLDEKAKKILA